MIAAGLGFLRAAASAVTGDIVIELAKEFLENSGRDIGSLWKANKADVQSTPPRTLLLSDNKEALPQLPPEAQKYAKVGDYFRQELGVPFYLVEWAARLQNAGRMAMIEDVFKSDSLDLVALRNAKTAFRFRRPVAIDNPLPDQLGGHDHDPPIAEADQRLRNATEGEQAITQVARLFVDALEKAQNLGDRTLYASAPVQDAIKGIRILSHQMKVSAVEGLELVGRDRDADVLRDEINRERLSTYGQEKPGMFAGVMRGIAGACEKLGYQTDGSFRNIWGLSTIARTAAGYCSRKGYEVVESVGQETLLTGIKSAVEQLEKSGRIELDRGHILNWVKAQALESGMEVKKVDTLLGEIPPEKPKKQPAVLTPGKVRPAPTVAVEPVPSIDVAQVVPAAELAEPAKLAETPAAAIIPDTPAALSELPAAQQGAAQGHGG
jgi:hypothetical protein